MTGGSRGIGRATALPLARAGADVGITHLKRSAEAERVVAEIRALGRKSFAAGGDLGDPEKVDRVFQSVKGEFGRLDLLVGNVGIWPEQEVPLQSMDYSRWKATLSANLDAIFLTTKAALALTPPPGGRVVARRRHGRPAG